MICFDPDCKHFLTPSLGLTIDYDGSPPQI